MKITRNSRGRTHEDFATYMSWSKSSLRNINAANPIALQDSSLFIRLANAYTR